MRLAALALTASFAACTGAAPPGGPPPPPPGPPSSNPIDVAIWPRLVSANLTALTPASNDELCRRMALDLLGAIPTPAEVAQSCTGKSPEEMAQAFLARPEFTAREQRLWIQHLRLDPARVYAGYLLEADGLVADLAGGKLPYDDFAARLLAHPAGATNRRPASDADDGKDYTAADTSSNALRVFLGRQPVGTEAQDFAHLFRVWTRALVDDPQLTPQSMVRRWEVSIDPSACAGAVYGTQACTSRALGADVTINLPMGAAQTWASFGGNLPQAIETELEKPGRLLAGRAEFWDEAADHALARFLGWWKSTRAEPDTDVPEVRAALSAWFKQQSPHDLRRLYVTILTSLLYTTSAETPPDAKNDPPPWAVGPTKAMSAEQYLDSTAKALARPLGFCDPHTSEAIGTNFYFPDRFRKAQPADFYGFGFDAYYTFGTRLGGCTGGQAPAREPGLATLFAESDLTAAVCAAPSVIAPANFDPSSGAPDNAKALADFLGRQILGRAPAADELDLIVKTASACAPDQSCGMQLFNQQLCGALLRSAPFLYY